MKDNQTKTQEHKLNMNNWKSRKEGEEKSLWRWKRRWVITPLEGWLLLDECAAATWGHHGSFKIRLEKKAQKLSNDHSKYEEFS